MFTPPFLLFYFFVRRVEYQADRESAALTRNPEIEISSLAKLHRAARTPFQVNRITDMFSTHPSLIHRVTSIARTNGISDAGVTEILRETEPRTKDRAKVLDTCSS